MFIDVLRREMGALGLRVIFLLRGHALHIIGTGLEDLLRVFRRCRVAIAVLATVKSITPQGFWTVSAPPSMYETEALDAAEGERIDSSTSSPSVFEAVFTPRVDGSR
jgi:hypothetical protein